MMTSRRQIQEQYRDASNLNARSAIYRFATSTGPPWPRWVFEQFSPDLPADARVLEIGCGDGALWKKNADRTPARWQVVLCDLSPGMLHSAGGLNFNRLQADAARLPIADHTFEAVVANHMLYHVDDRRRALAEIRRVLKPGGRLYATTNSNAHMSEMKDLIERFLGERSPLSGPIPFNLENGEAQLRPFFSRIETRRIGGELRVTDPDAVIRYVMSINESQELIVGERFEELGRIVRERIAAGGAFVCHTATGMFIATA